MCVNNMEKESIIERHFKLQLEVYNYFNYFPNWVYIPMDFRPKTHWMICGPEDNSSTSIVYSPIEFTEKSIEEGSNIYGGSLYTQRFLPKWVYRGENYTMISVDTHCDGNKLLLIFENVLECNDDKLKNLYNMRWK